MSECQPIYYGIGNRPSVLVNALLKGFLLTLGLDGRIERRDLTLFSGGHRKTPPEYIFVQSELAGIKSLGAQSFQKFMDHNLIDFFQKPFLDVFLDRLRQYLHERPEAKSGTPLSLCNCLLFPCKELFKELLVLGIETLEILPPSRVI
jgi:hypothetical protein